MMPTQPYPRPAAEDGARMAGAARQAILRRVAPALKHDMVVNLQSVAMMAEMLNARVQRGSVSPSDLQANISKLNRLAREAVMGCVKVTSWIESPADDHVTLHQGVEECLALLATSFNFRGFHLVNEVDAAEFEVERGTLRFLLAGSLLALSDAASAPCELVVQADPQGSHARLAIHAQPRADTPEAPLPAASDGGPRPRVEWQDVEALANTESVTLERSARGVVMHLPRAVVTSPLQMAPV